MALKITSKDVCTCIDFTWQSVLTELANRQEARSSNLLPTRVGFYVHDLNCAQSVGIPDELGHTARRKGEKIWR